MKRRIAPLLLVLAMPAAAAVAVVGGSASATTRAPACVVRIARFAFRPSTAPEGAPVVLRTAIANCTAKSQTVRLTQFGTEPPGCPVIDPLARSVTIAPNAVYRTHSAMTAAPCAGTERFTLRVTDQAGNLLGQRNADLTVTKSS